MHSDAAIQVYLREKRRLVDGKGHGTLDDKIEVYFTSNRAP